MNRLQQLLEIQRVGESRSGARVLPSELCALNQASSFIGDMDVLSPRMIFLLFFKMHVTSYCLLRNSILQMQGNIITEKKRLITSFLFPEHRPKPQLI